MTDEKKESSTTLNSPDPKVTEDASTDGQGQEEQIDTADDDDTDDAAYQAAGARSSGRNAAERRIDGDGSTLRASIKEQVDKRAQRSARREREITQAAMRAIRRLEREKERAQRTDKLRAGLSSAQVDTSVSNGDGSDATASNYPAATPKLVYNLELVVCYAGWMLTRHGVLEAATKTGGADLLPSVFWAHIALEEHETITCGELDSRIVKIAPKPLPDAAQRVIVQVFGGQVCFRPGSGMPLVSVVATGKAFKTTLLAHVWRQSPHAWYQPYGEPTLAAQGISIFYVIRVLRSCTLTGRLGLLDGIRSLLMIGPGGLRRSGLRTRAILDHAALAACVGNVITTSLPPTPLDALEEIDRDLETASSIQISGIDKDDKDHQAHIDEAERLVRVFYRIRGREAQTRSLGAERVLKVVLNEEDWMLGQLLNLSAPNAGWTEPTKKRYAALYPFVLENMFAGRQPTHFTRVALDAKPSYLQREGFSYAQLIQQAGLTA